MQIATTAIGVLFALSAGIGAAFAADDDPPPVAQAVQIEGEAPPIDGSLDHPSWERAPAATDFTQRQPDTGDPASQTTRVRVLYDDQALYIGARMEDDAPEEILAPLMHQDAAEGSDWFVVTIDSYQDGRTGFTFGVNPRGVRLDYLFYNDYMEDRDWTAVWEAGAQIDDRGWTATLRIPLSQLRFRGDGEQRWGINFAREIPRRNELSLWSPTPPDEQAIVSKFGVLEGIFLSERRLRFEAAPHVSSSVNRKAPALRTPLDDPLSGSLGAGIDLKYGITPRLTLSSTIYPDFGQVQVDPAVINLTAFETIFPERRPFFQEGAEIFAFDGTRTYNAAGRPTSFYSRRIGAPPEERTQRDDIEHITYPAETDIIGAAKLSGQTGDGWSIGALNAVTASEEAEFVDESGERGRLQVTPLTNHFMGVMERRLAGGNTRFGVQSGAVNRFTDQPHLRSQLIGNSYVGGLSFEHLFLDESMAFSGILQGSYLQGHEDAVAARQRHPSRYMNRPDADHLDFDPQRTTMSGLASEISLARIRGSWNYSLTYNTTSPAFDVNEMGYQLSADLHAISGLVMYSQHQPTSLFQQWSAFAFSNVAWDYGGNRTLTLLSSNANVTLHNNWRISAEAQLEPGTFDKALTRGGPMAWQPTSWSSMLDVRTYSGQDVYGNLGASIERDRAGNQEVGISGRITYRPLYSVGLSLEPGLTMHTSQAQYITAVEDPSAEDTFGHRYVFSELDLTTLDLGIRMRWTLSPHINMQLFAQPLLSAGRFMGFSEFSEPGAYRFNMYGEDAGRIEEIDGGYRVTPDTGDPFEFSDPNFIQRSLRANAVLEWEYHRGSYLHVVWQLNQFDDNGAAKLDPFRDVGHLGRAPAEHTLMVKLTYWFGR